MTKNRKPAALGAIAATAPAAVPVTAAPLSVPHAPPPLVPIRFMFMLGMGFSSWAIARFGFSAGGWSHVAPMLPDGSYIDSRDDWIHAPPKGWKFPGFAPSIPPGVQHRPPNYCKRRRWAVVEIMVTPEQAQEWESYLRKHIGAKYDRAAIWGFALGRKMHSAKRFICSAFSLSSLERLRVFQKSDIGASEVSPDSLYVMMRARPGSRIVARS